jgi:Holliday junction resolvase RusA-like endonuclease
MTKLDCWIPMLPQGKGRHRSRMTKGGHIQSYPDPKTVKAEKLMQGAWIAKHSRRGLELWPKPKAVALTMVVFLPRPVRPLAPLPVTKPDFDNLGKMVDALNGIAFTDDSQITTGRVYKRYALQGMTPGVYILLEDDLPAVNHLDWLASIVAGVGKQERMELSL